MGRYLFTDLGKEAQRRAVSNYLNGWLETHPKDDLTYTDVYYILQNDVMLYDRNGIYMEDII